jgi:hypothetical protein
MGWQTRPHFPHRQNRDGSFDSICTICFATVATVIGESELARHEEAHICDPFWAGMPVKFPVSSVRSVPNKICVMPKRA